MARSSQDDPVPIQRRFGPTIETAVAKELAARKLTPVTDAPDVRFHYYLLVTVGFDTQTTGQFLPPVMDWGIPIFTPSTSSYKITQNGALVLDAVSSKLRQGRLARDRAKRARSGEHGREARRPPPRGRPRPGGEIPAQEVTAEIAETCCRSMLGVLGVFRGFF